MIGELFDIITEGIGDAWEFVTEIPSRLSEAFGGEVNVTGWLLLSGIGEAILIFCWFFTLNYFKANEAYEAINSMFSITNLIICIIATPIVCYFIAKYYAGKE